MRPLSPNPDVLGPGNHVSSLFPQLEPQVRVRSFTSCDPDPMGPLHSLPHLTVPHSITVKGMDRTLQQTPHEWLTQPHLLSHPLNRTREYLPVSQWDWEGSVG